MKEWCTQLQFLYGKKKNETCKLKIDCFKGTKDYMYSDDILYC